MANFAASDSRCSRKCLRSARPRACGRLRRQSLRIANLVSVFRRNDYVTETKLSAFGLAVAENATARRPRDVCKSVRGAAMGLFDKVVSGMVKGIAKTVDPGALPGLVTQYLAKTEIGDTANLIKRLREGGLDREVDSWLGSGPNLPVTPEQVRAALGDSVIEQAVAVTGIPADKLLVLMAGYLPNAVDAMSPNGTIEGTPPA
ncbi:MAG: YidB family protein [Xanthobacteraceae bacterium]